MSKKRNRNRSPKRTLALPDLEQSKAAVLNTHQRAVSTAMIAPSRILLIGTAQSRGSHSTAPWFRGTGSISNRSSTLPRRLI
jgi:hypothetical protein